MTPVKAWDPASEAKVLYRQGVRIQPLKMIAVSKAIGVERVFAQGARATTSGTARAEFQRHPLAYAGASSYRMDFIDFIVRKSIAQTSFHLSKRIDGFDCSVVIWFAKLILSRYSTGNSYPHLRPRLRA